MAYFNQNYVATGKIAREYGRKIAQLQQKREKSDYDDFYIASQEEAQIQLNSAKVIVGTIEDYL